MGHYLSEIAVRWVTWKKVAVYSGLAVGIMTITMLSYQGSFSAQSAQDGSADSSDSRVIEVGNDSAEQEKSGPDSPWRSLDTDEISQPIPLNH